MVGKSGVEISEGCGRWIGEVVPEGIDESHAWTAPISMTFLSFLALEYLLAS